MESLEDYSKRMVQEFNQTSWLIGWESLPKYIGHKIFNTSTKETVTVMWDNGYPESLSLDTKMDVGYIKLEKILNYKKKGYISS